MTEIQLDIIRTFGSKQLSEGCKVNVTYSYYKLSESQLSELRNKYGKCLLRSDMENDDNDFFNLSFNRDELIKEGERNYGGTIIRDLDVFKQVLVSAGGHSPHLVQTHIHNIINDSGKLSTLFEDYAFSTYEVSEILGHIPNLQDLFIIGKRKGFTIDISNREEIAIPIRTYWGTNHREFGDIEYDFSLPLIDQDEQLTLLPLLNLLGQNKKK